MDFCLIAPEHMGNTVHNVCWKEAVTTAPLPMCYKIYRDSYIITANKPIISAKKIAVAKFI